MPSRKFHKHTLITALIMLFIAVVITYKNVEGFQTTQSYNILASLNLGSVYFVVITDLTYVYTLSQMTPFSFDTKYNISTSINLNNYPNKIATSWSAYATDFGSKAQNTRDNRFIGSALESAFTPAYWFVAESKINYKFSNDLTLDTNINKYITAINYENVQITLYNMDNSPVLPSDLPSTIPAGVGHMKYISPADANSDRNEWRYSVQLKSGWKYVKLGIEPYVAQPVLITPTSTTSTTSTAPTSTTPTLTTSTTPTSTTPTLTTPTITNNTPQQGISPPPGSPASPDGSNNIFLIGTGIAVGVVMLSFLFRR